MPEHGLQHAEGRQGTPDARPDRHLRGPEGRARLGAGLPQELLPDQGRSQKPGYVLFYQN